VTHFPISGESFFTLTLVAAHGVNADSMVATRFLGFTLDDIRAATHQLTMLQFRKNPIVRDHELHLASRMTDRRCRPLWAWNGDQVTGRRWLDGTRLTVGLLSELTDRCFFVYKEN